MSQFLNRTNSNIIYSDLFDDNPLDIKDLISCISINDGIFWCCKINTLLTSTGIVKYYTDIINLLGLNRNNYKLKKIVDDKKLQSLKFYTYALMPYITMYCEKKPYDLETFTTYPAYKENFLKALVISGEKWLEKASYSTNTNQNEQEIALLARKEMEICDNQKDFINSYAYSSQIYIQYFNKVWNDFNSSFKNCYGINIEDYWLAVLFIFLNLVTAKGLEPKIVNDDCNNVETIRSLISLKSCDIDNLHIESVDKVRRQFLRNPILYAKAYKGCLIFDPIRFIEAFEDGIIFDICSNSYSVIDVPGINGFYGEAFENYIADSFNRTLNTSLLFAKRFYNGFEISNILKLQNKKKIDGYLDYGEIAIPIEIKAIFLRDEYKNNGTAFKAGLIDLYDNACNQLAEAIRAIVESDNSMFSSCKMIIPLLIVRDSYLNSPLTSKIIADHFKTKISSFSKTILPIIIMTIDEFEMLIGNRNLDWSKFLLSYSKADYERKSSINNFISASNDELCLKENDDNKEYIISMLNETRKLFGTE